MKRASVSFWSGKVLREKHKVKLYSEIPDQFSVPDWICYISSESC
jgi:hypothetical protein